MADDASSFVCRCDGDSAAVVAAADMSFESVVALVRLFFFGFSEQEMTEGGREGGRERGRRREKFGSIKTGALPASHQTSNVKRIRQKIYVFHAHVLNVI